MNARPIDNELYHFAERLKKERKRIGLNQTEFARLGDVAKNSQLNYETAKTPAPVDYLYKIAAHGVDISYLLTGQVDSALPADEALFIKAFRQLSLREKRAVSGLIFRLLGVAPVLLRDEGDAA